MTTYEVTISHNGEVIRVSTFSCYLDAACAIAACEGYGYTADLVVIYPNGRSAYTHHTSAS